MEPVPDLGTMAEPGGSPRAMLITKTVAEAAVAEQAGLLTHRQAARIRAMLDFGDAALGDPAWDLAVLTLDDPGRLPAVLTRRHRELLRAASESAWVPARGPDADA